MSRSLHNVTYQQWTRYKTATDWLSDFNLGMGVVIKADKDWHFGAASGRLNALQWPHFLILLFLFSYIFKENLMIKRVLLLLYKAQHRLRSQICKETFKATEPRRIAFGLVMTWPLTYDLESLFSKFLLTWRIRVTFHSNRSNNYRYIETRVIGVKSYRA